MINENKEHKIYDSFTKKISGIMINVKGRACFLTSSICTRVNTENFYNASAWGSDVGGKAHETAGEHRVGVSCQT